MERFFKVLHSRSGQTWSIARFPGALSGRGSVLDGVSAERRRADGPPVETGRDAAVSERSKNWVKHTRDCFDGPENHFGGVRAKRAFDLQPNREMLLLVKDRVERLEQWRARILGYFPDKAYTDKWFPPMRRYAAT